jgi:hypothetical protein
MLSTTGFVPDAVHCTKTKAMPLFRYNASGMLNEFRRILRCPGYESGHIQQDFMPADSNTYSFLQNELSVQAAPTSSLRSSLPFWE